jgi:predicted DNA-binding transcriptional regulator AlpA
MQMVSSVPCNPIDPLLTEEEVSRLLSLSMRTLQVWRVRGGGPPFVRCGRSIRYRKCSVVDWIDARTVPSVEAS